MVFCCSSQNRMDLRSQSRKEEAPELHLAFGQLHDIEGLSGSTLRSLLACVLTGDRTSVFCPLCPLCSGPPDPGATQESTQEYLEKELQVIPMMKMQFEEGSYHWGLNLNTKTVGPEEMAQFVNSSAHIS